LECNWAYTSNIPEFFFLALAFNIVLLVTVWSRHDGRDQKHENGKNLLELHFVVVVHVDPWKCCERGVDEKE